MTEQIIHKDNVLESIDHRRSAFRRYQDFFVGKPGVWQLTRYELAQMFAGPIPGAAGYLLRKLLTLPLLKHAGAGVQIGQNVSLRHPGKISIGDRTAIDDLCLLDARGVKYGTFSIGSEVIISRGSVIASKTDHGFVEIDDSCTISKNCLLTSTGGIRIGKFVGIADGCILGGGRYKTNQRNVPMMKQELYTKGPVVVEEDCWIGMGVRILDGVTVGRGSIIGAGAVLREDIPAYTVVAPHQRLVKLPRAMDDDDDSSAADASPSTKPE